MITLNEFLSDIENHTIKIIKNDGVYRHINCSNNGSSVHGFNIITWPNHLCIEGDMGCTVFSRINDMFNFFWMDRNDFNNKTGNELNINPCYWREKIVSAKGDVFKFNKERFLNSCQEYLDEFIDDCDWDEDTRDALINEWEYEIFQYDSEDICKGQVNDFHFSWGGNEFTFDLHELDTGNEYSIHYIWQLYAIVWTIKQYKTLLKEVI